MGTSFFFSLFEIPYYFAKTRKNLQMKSFFFFRQTRISYQEQNQKSLLTTHLAIQAKRRDTTSSGIREMVLAR